MQSKTKKLKTCDAQKIHARSFEFYEEYSQRTIAEVIRTRRGNFDNCNPKVKRGLLTEVEREIKGFRTWLEETKNLETSTAHYYSVSLKSLLLGLPVGVQVAQLFCTILATHAKKSAPTKPEQTLTQRIT